ncbi:unnamed protein product, partial [Mesorhabditis belari]|uniref:Uncharacterized protein n=1 Tax=Mesorhabditis belari TaxID=2138241 RepID=A0AAF3JB84_9BILA
MFFIPKKDYDMMGGSYQKRSFFQQSEKNNAARDCYMQPLDTGKTILRLKSNVEAKKTNNVAANYVTGKTMLKLKERDPATGKFYPNDVQGWRNLAMDSAEYMLTTKKILLEKKEPTPRPLMFNDVLAYKKPVYKQSLSNLKTNEALASHKTLLTLRNAPVKAPSLSDAALDEQICQWIKKTETNLQRAKSNALDLEEQRLLHQTLYERRGHHLSNLAFVPSPTRGFDANSRGSATTLNQFSFTPKSFMGYRDFSPLHFMVQNTSELKLAVAAGTNGSSAFSLPPLPPKRFFD